MKKISLVVTGLICLFWVSGCSRSLNKSESTQETSSLEVETESKEVVETTEIKETIYGKYLHTTTGDFDEEPELDAVEGVSKEVRQKPVPERYPDELVLKEDGLVDFIYYQKDEEGEAEVASNVKLFT